MGNDTSDDGRTVAPGSLVDTRNLADGREQVEVKLGTESTMATETKEKKETRKIVWWVDVVTVKSKSRAYERK